jgi:hypothetical protein
MAVSDDPRRLRRAEIIGERIGGEPAADAEHFTLPVALACFTPSFCRR